MAAVCEFVLAAVGLATVILAGSTWLLIHLDDDAKDLRTALRRISNEAHATQRRIAHEEMRQVIAEIERSQTPETLRDGDGR
jgi:hypothetical protein